MGILNSAEEAAALVEMLDAGEFADDPEGESAAYAALTEFDQQQQAAAPPTGPNLPEVKTPGMQIQDFIQQAFKSKDGTTSVTNQMGANFFSGVARSYDSTKTAVAQMMAWAGGDKATERTLEQLETVNRNAYDKSVDGNGLGAEDFGESFFSLASLFLPSPTKIVTAKNAVTAGIDATKFLGRLHTMARGTKEISSKLAGNAAANAVLVGAQEFFKANAEGENRLERSLGAAGAGLAGHGVLKTVGKFGPSVFSDGFIGNAVKAAAVNKAAGIRNWQIRDGIGRHINRTFLGRKAKDYDQELALKNAGQLSNQQTQRASNMVLKKELEIVTSPAERSARDWEITLDILQGPKNAKGVRNGGFIRTRSNPYAKKTGISNAAEASQIESVLSMNALTKNPDGTVAFDRVKFIQDYLSMRSQSEFQQRFGRIAKDGTFKPNKTVKKMDEWVDELRTRGPSLGPIAEAWEGARRRMTSAHDEAEAARLAVGMKPTKNRALDVLDRAGIIIAGEAAAQNNVGEGMAGTALEAMTAAWELLAKDEDEATNGK